MNEVKEGKNGGTRSPGVFVTPLSNEVKEGKTEGLEVPEFLLRYFPIKCSKSSGIEVFTIAKKKH